MSNAFEYTQNILPYYQTIIEFDISKIATDNNGNKFFVGNIHGDTIYSVERTITYYSTSFEMADNFDKDNILSAKIILCPELTIIKLYTRIAGMLFFNAYAENGVVVSAKIIEDKDYEEELQY